MKYKYLPRNTYTSPRILVSHNECSKLGSDHRVLACYETGRLCSGSKMDNYSRGKKIEALNKTSQV